MGTRAHNPVRLLVVVASLEVMACQGSDLTLPGDGSPSSLNAVSGHGQRGTVNSKLPQPLVVRVTDAAGRPVREVSLRFETRVPAADISPSVIATNDSGVAVVQVRLGSIQGIQTVEASVADATLKTTFEFIALANQPEDGGNDDDDGDSAGGGDGGDGDGSGRGRGNGNGGGYGENDDDD